MHVIRSEDQGVSTRQELLEHQAQQHVPISPVLRKLKKLNKDGEFNASLGYILQTQLKPTKQEVPHTTSTQCEIHCATATWHLIARILPYVSLMSGSTKSQRHMEFTVLYATAKSHKLKPPKHMSSLSWKPEPTLLHGLAATIPYGIVHDKVKHSHKSIQQRHNGSPTISQIT